MNDHLTPKEAGDALGLSESTIKRWCDRQELSTVRTPGGHRRIPLSAILELARRDHYELVRPEVVGLPARLSAPQDLASASTALVEHLKRGDVGELRRIAFALHLAGVSAEELADRLLAPAMRELGTSWQHGTAEVYQERRAVELVSRLVHELRIALPEPAPEAPLAIGGTLAPDNYQLASAMVEWVLRAQGFRTQQLGAANPGATLAAALRDLRPRLFWLSASFIPDRSAFLADFERIAAAAEEVGTVVVVGGNALDADLRSRMRYACFGDTLAHLSTFVRTLQGQL